MSCPPPLASSVRPRPRSARAAWAALATVAALAGQAHAQEPATPGLGRPTVAPLPLTGSGTSGGLTLPQGLLGSGAPGAPAGPVQTTSGGGGAAGTRPILRGPRPRQTRRPTVGLSGGDFRSTLIAPEVAANVQPGQTGLPDPPLLPAARPPVRRPAIVEDPYAPLGIRLGGLTLFPLVGQSIGYDSNPNRTRINRQGSFVSQTEGELRVQSDWSRDELTGFLRGAYNEYPSNPGASRPEGAGRIGYRHDVTRDTQLDAEAHYLIDTQRPDSPDLNADVRERPIVFTSGASAGATQRFNRLIVGVRGTVDRADYEDARLSNGLVQDQSDRNVTQVGGRLRVGYELHPGFVPFVEAVADTRIYDRRIDNTGFARSSDGVGASLGTTFEITRLLTGEISAGAIARRYEDRRLGDLVSPLANGSLVYALTPLTTVRATAQAGVDETTIPNATGVRTLRGSLEVAHDLRRNLTLTAGVTASDYEYQGVGINERSFGALLRADYRLNRQVTLRASYTYDRLESTFANSSYDANVVLLGVRLQP